MINTDLATTSNFVTISKIKNGSKIVIGQVTVFVDKRFNKFQKLMIKWCFGFDVEDYSEV